MKTCPTCQAEYDDSVEFCANDGMKLPKFASVQQDDPMIGRTLDGRWIIESKIGEGGMGAVYKGHQRSVNREVAIKTLRANLMGQEDFVNRFFREAHVATQINHPHCVTILDFGQEEDGTLYLAMEFLDGEPLADLLESQGSVNIKRTLKIGEQLASALAAAHDQNIVHRDLKPDNIFMLSMAAGNTFIKVLDFGIAKVTGANTQYTRTGQVFGTPDYMSPEQCSGVEIDGRSDLYSVGCILYELLCGAPPFKQESAMAIMMAHVGEEPQPISELVDLPPELSHLIMTLLQKDPNDRIQSASDLHSQMQQILALTDGSGAQNIVRSPSPSLGVSDTIAQPHIPTEPQAATPKHTTQEYPVKGSKRPLIVLGIVVFSLVIAAGAIAAILANDSGSKETSSSAAATAVRDVEKTTEDNKGLEQPTSVAKTQEEQAKEAQEVIPKKIATPTKVTPPVAKTPTKKAPRPPTKVSKKRTSPTKPNKSRKSTNIALPKMPDIRLNKKKNQIEVDLPELPTIGKPNKKKKSRKSRKYKLPTF